MNKELVINSSSKGVDIALLENKKLVELSHEAADTVFSVGDIFIGKIIRLVPGLNAAFVNVGYEKDAFLHYTDLGPNIRSLVKYTNMATRGQLNSHLLKDFKFERQIVKTGKITEALNKKHPILVQVLKEPISTKGPRLTCEISLSGRYMVLTPFSSGIHISKKIESKEEKERLRRLLESIKPKNFGVIVRTAAQKKKASELMAEVNGLVEKWKDVKNGLRTAVSPEKVLSEDDKTSTLLRDLLSDSFNKIVVNDKNMQGQVTSYVKSIAPGKEKIVQLHNSKRSIFDHYDITKQIKSSFGKTVNIQGGSYLVIEHTEAMHVIDVNSGHKSGSNMDQENQALMVNLESASEVARQLRLRDIGGIIIVDFIDMKKAENKKLVYNRMRDMMKDDRAKHTVLPLSRFGLMQITRQRVKPAIKIATQENCPSCMGSGKIKSTILLSDDINENLEYLVREMNHKGLKLIVHPYIQAFLTKGIYSKQMEWFWKYKQWTKIESVDDYALTEYQFLDASGEKIELGS